MNNGFELNKIAAAILVAGIIAMLAGFITEAIYSDQDVEKRGYKIEGVTEAVVTTASQEFKFPEFEIGKLMAAANPEAGKALFNKCGVCHGHDKAATPKVGPTLWGIVGAKKAAHTDYTYSTAMSEKGGNWEYEDLFKLLYAPKQFIKGTKMGFAGMTKPEEIANVVAYLRSLSDAPVALPDVNMKSSQ